MFEEKLSKKDQVYFLLSSVSGREICHGILLDCHAQTLKVSQKDRSESESVKKLN